jgi:hypothetical protein
VTTLLYGEAQSEKRAAENMACRQVVHEISNFGFSQRQLLLIIHLLALELENVTHMRAINQLVRSLSDNEMFLIGNPEPDQEIKGAPDGTSNI